MRRFLSNYFDHLFYETSSTEVVNSVKNILLLKSLVYCGQSVLTNLKTNFKILTIFSIKTVVI